MIEKNRYWTFIVYPESAPSDWQTILSETGLPIAISPIHDRDINEATGELKKAHYHILLCFPGPTTFNKVNSICAELNSPIPKRILSVIGIYRYLTHTDNPEKAQYFEEDIKVLNGFDIHDFKGLTANETLAIKKELQNLIIYNDFTEYSIFIDYIKDNYDLRFYEVAVNNTVFFDRYLSSRRNFKKERY